MPVNPAVQACSASLLKRVQESDPVCGVWQVSNLATSAATVWCDASNLAIGVTLEVEGNMVEDGCWLRPYDDMRHINVVELDSVVKGLTLAVKWKLKNVKVVTDSRSVSGWLQRLVSNSSRVRVSGLQEVLVLRRLQIIEDLIATTGMQVEVQWVPSEANHADLLTRVPKEWQKMTKRQPPVAVVVTSLSVVGPVTREQIEAGQKDDTEIQRCSSWIASGSVDSLPGPYKKAQSQLLVDDGLLCRSVKLPLEGSVVVPVIPASLQHDVVSSAHINCAHGGWETMYHMLRSRCFFPNMASSCQEYVKQCTSCQSANSAKGPAARPTRPDIPGKPWSEVQMDTLELGADRGGLYHCVLVVVDTFTKWVEVEPLKHHDASSVAKAFVRISTKRGPPDVVRLDNGSEFANAIVESLFQKFGVRVRTGAVRHPQSQGAAERTNRTLLTIMRKTMEESSSWKEDLDMILYYYRIRPHSSTKLSPFQAMTGWQPKNLLVEDEVQVMSMSEWSDKLSQRCAAVRDFVEAEWESFALRRAYICMQPMRLRLRLGGKRSPQTHFACM